jgi:hypothetical protein
MDWGDELQERPTSSAIPTRASAAASATAAGCAVAILGRRSVPKQVCNPVLGLPVERSPLRGGPFQRHGRRDAILQLVGSRVELGRAEHVAFERAPLERLGVILRRIRSSRWLCPAGARDPVAKQLASQRTTRADVCHRRVHQIRRFGQLASFDIAQHERRSGVERHAIEYAVEKLAQALALYHRIRQRQRRRRQ